jgi:hypothetical protein
MASTELFNLPLFDDANLQAYYRFNTGALTTDSKGSNTLTNNNTVGETASGKFGYAADFGNANTNKTFTRTGTYNIVNWSDSFSFSAWIKRYGEIGSGEQRFLFKQINPAASGGGLVWMGYQYNSGTRRFACGRYDEAGTQLGVINTNLGTDWHHVVMVYDGTNITPYLDGVAGTPVASDGTSAGESYGNTFGLGYDSNTNFWSGYIDDVAVFNKALTANEVLSIYRSNAKGALFFAQY